MNTAVALIPKERALLKNNQQTSALVAAEVITKVGKENVRYLDDSALYQLRGGAEAEVIHNPRYKFTRAGIVDQVTNELGYILVKSFGYEQDKDGLFLGGNRFTRVAIDVDWLVVVRKRSQPIAFGAGTFIAPFLFYVNSAMVLPDFQPMGVGSISIALLLKVAREYAVEEYKYEPDIVCRTHNCNAASALLPALVDNTISSEPELSKYSQMIFEKTAEYLNCPYDKNTGISRNVYPCELPTNIRTSNKRVSEAFKHLEIKDACYVTGRLNVKFISRLISKTTYEKMTQSVPNVELPVWPMVDMIPA